MSEFAAFMAVAVGVVVAIFLLIVCAGFLFQAGCGLLGPWSRLRNARADLQIARMKRDAAIVDRELAQLERGP